MAIAGFAWFAPPASDDTSQPPNRGPATSTFSSPVAKASPPSGFAALPDRLGIGERAGELFGALSWAPPPAKPDEAPPAAPPTAPQNPYKFAARLIQGGAATVFLAKGERIYEVKIGDDLDGGYRVESIAADRVVLVYLPLGTKDELPASSTLGIDAPPAAPLLASAPSAGPAPSAVAADDPSKLAQLRWEGPAQVRAGKSFNVALRVSSGQQLRASPMQLSFKPDVLEPLNVRAGKFFGEGNFSYRINPDGSIFVGASTSGSAPGADAELLVVTFRPIKAGATAEVGLSSLALQGAAGRAIAHDPISAFRTAIQ